VAWWNTEVVYPPKTVTHPSTNRARRRVTSLIRAQRRYRYARPPRHCFGRICNCLRPFDLVCRCHSIVHSINCRNCRNLAFVVKSMKFSAEILKIVQIKMGYGGKVSVLSVLWKSCLVSTTCKKIETHIFNHTPVRIVNFMQIRYVSELNSDRNR